MNGGRAADDPFVLPELIRGMAIQQRYAESASERTQKSLLPTLPSLFSNARHAQGADAASPLVECLVCRSSPLMAGKQGL